MIENPGGSCILLHPWLQWAIKTIQGANGYVASMDFGFCLGFIQPTKSQGEVEIRNQLALINQI